MKQVFFTFPRKRSSQNSSSQSGKEDKEKRAEKKSGPQVVDIAKEAFKQYSRNQHYCVNVGEEIQDHEKNVTASAFPHYNGSVEEHLKESV